MVWEYVAIGAASGLVWGGLQFLRRVSDEEKDARWVDFDWLRTISTCVYNAAGAGVASRVSR